MRRGYRDLVQPSGSAVQLKNFEKEDGVSSGLLQCLAITHKKLRLNNKQLSTNLSHLLGNGVNW